MKITVEMTVDDFADFLRFREGKKAEETEAQRERKKLRVLSNAVLDALEIHERTETVTVKGFGQAKRAFDYAEEWRL